MDGDFTLTSCEMFRGIIKVEKHLEDERLSVPVSGSSQNPLTAKSSSCAAGCVGGGVPAFNIFP